MANVPQKSLKYPGLSDTYTFIQESDVLASIASRIDSTLATSGRAADAKATGDALNLKVNISDIDNTLSIAAKPADAKAVGDAINAITNFVTPQMYGAVGDGTTDDTAAVQDAIDSGYVVICDKEYKVTGLTITNPRTKIYISGKINLFGTIFVTGSYSTISGYPSGRIVVMDNDFPAIVIGDNDGAQSKDTVCVRIEKIDFSGYVNPVSGDATYGQYGIVLRNLRQSTYTSYFHKILDCNFRYFDVAIQFTGEANGNYIENLHLWNCGTSTTVGAIHCANSDSRYPSENMMKNVFHHYSPGKTTFSTEATSMQFWSIELIAEQSDSGSTHPYTIYIPNTVSCYGCYINLNSNSSGGNVVPDSYRNNNVLIANGLMRCNAAYVNSIKANSIDNSNLIQKSYSVSGSEGEDTVLGYVKNTRSYINIHLRGISYYASQAKNQATFKQFFDCYIRGTLASNATVVGNDSPQRAVTYTYDEDNGRGVVKCKFVNNGTGHTLRWDVIVDYMIDPDDTSEIFTTPT